MEEMISAPCSFRAAFPSEHPLKNESMKQCIRREKANPRSTKVPSSYGFALRQSPRPRHLPEGNKISERYFFGFVEKPTPLRAPLQNKAEIQHFSGSSVILGSPQELRRPARCCEMASLPFKYLLSKQSNSFRLLPVNHLFEKGLRQKRRGQALLPCPQGFGCRVS